MLKKINFIKNVGKLKNVSLKEPIPGSTITLIYAENGRGKTTLSSILRSLATGDSSIISTRRNLEEEGEPQISIGIGETNYNYQDGSWEKIHPNIKIYDDAFVNENLYSGTAINSPHRQNLHKTITLGEGRIKLYEELEGLKKNVKKLDKELSKKRQEVAEIANFRGMDIDKYCALSFDDEIETRISDCRNRLVAIEKREEIQRKETLSFPTLPIFDINEIEGLLLQDIQVGSLKKVLKHINNLDKDGESWLRDGLRHLEHFSSTNNASCPFCAQSTADADMIQRLRNYFSKEYKSLTNSLEEAIRKIEELHDDNQLSHFQLLHLEFLNSQNYWRGLIPDLPPINNIDVNEVLENWREARKNILSLLERKVSSPRRIDRIDNQLREIIDKHNQHRDRIQDAVKKSLENNRIINLLKQETVFEDRRALKKKLDLYECQKERHEGDIKRACEEYITARNNKSQAELSQRDAEKGLKSRDEDLWSRMEKSINKYLKIFGAKFQIRDVVSSDRNLHFEADYQIEICGKRVGLASKPREPSFKTVLSSGDRSTLALAFFLSNLHIQWEESLDKQIVVFDDPVASLDEHREKATIKEICRLSNKVEQIKQILVLSHSRPFIASLFDECSRSPTKNQGEVPLYKLTRKSTASQIKKIGIKDLSMPDNGSRRRLVKQYVEDEESGDYSTVGEALRPILEHNILNSFGEYRSDNQPISSLAAKMVDEGLMSKDKLKEFRELYSFASSFHHDDSAFASVGKNDQQLQRYCERTLRFNPEKKEDE